MQVEHRGPPGPISKLPKPDSDNEGNCIRPSAFTAGFSAWGLGFRVQGLGFGVQGLGFRVR